MKHILSILYKGERERGKKVDYLSNSMNIFTCISS